MFRTELPLLYELRDSIRNPDSSDSYFQNFDENLANSSHVMDLYLRWEKTLQGLDPNAWLHLKGECVPRLIARHVSRGWEQLFDILGEARAYNLLRCSGATSLRFIPRTDRKTPDLECQISSGRLLCEVKTINISDKEATFRVNPRGVRSFSWTVAPAFLKKLHSTIERARDQLVAFDPEGFATHMIYLNIGFDDFFAEGKEAYFAQIDVDLARCPPANLRLVIANDYTAFYKPLQMRNAEVDNLG